MIDHVEPCSDKDWNSFFPFIMSKKISRGDEVARLGSDEYQCGILLTGCLKVYTQNADGSECIMQFIGENQFFGLAGKVTKDILMGCKAVSDAEICTLRSSLFSKNQYLIRLRGKLMMKSLNSANIRISLFSMHSPEERYLMFLERYKKLLKYIPEYSIAAYIGISPVHLSRLKKNIVLAS